MLNLLQAEWIKLSRRPLTWVLLSIFLSLLIIWLATLFLVVAIHDGIFNGGTTRIQLLGEAQVDQYRLQLRFPGIFGAVLGQINGIGGICAIVLAAGALGSEYSWGTLRLHLARHPQRGRYLLAKILIMLFLLLTAMVIAISIGSLFAVLFGLILGNMGTITFYDLLTLPVGIIRALYIMLPYIMFTLACAIIGRSVLAGAAGGLIFLTLDVSIGALSFIAGVGGPLSIFYSMMIQPNINTLVVLNSRSYGLDPSIVLRYLDLTTLPSPLQATLIIAGYSALFFGYAYIALIRRDITGSA